jgi:hypothetical protein
MLPLYLQVPRRQNVFICISNDMAKLIWVRSVKSATNTYCAYVVWKLCPCPCPFPCPPPWYEHHAIVATFFVQLFPLRYATIVILLKSLIHLAAIAALVLVSTHHTNYLSMVHAYCTCVRSYYQRLCLRLHNYSCSILLFA